MRAASSRQEAFERRPSVTCLLIRRGILAVTGGVYSETTGVNMRYTKVVAVIVFLLVGLVLIGCSGKQSL